MFAGNATSVARFRVFIISALATMSLGLVALPAIASAAAPTANPAFSATDDVTPVVVTLSAGDGGTPPVEFSIVSTPSGGTLGSVTNTPPASATVTYTAGPTFAGIDTFEFRATNDDGDSDETGTVIVRPQTAINTGPSGLINTKTPSWEFSSPQTGVTFQCRIDSGSWDACSSPFTAPSLSEGAHTFEVRANAGGGVVDTSPASFSVFVDTIPPVVTLEQASGQLDPTNAAPIEFELGSSEALSGATVEASDFAVTNGSVSAITGGPTEFTIEVTPAADGDVSIAPSGTFSVADPAGNVATTADGTDRTVTYDTTPPNVVLEQHPSQADPTNTAPVNFQFSSNENLNPTTVTDSDFSATNGTVASVTGGPTVFTIAITPAAEGPVSVAPSGTFSVSDVAGNATTIAAGADRTVIYDLTPPSVSIAKAPGQNDPTTSTAIEFEMTADEALNASTVTLNDFQVTNADLESVTGSGDTYKIAVTATAEDQIVLTASPDFEVADRAGNTQDTPTYGDNSVLYDTPPNVTLQVRSGQVDPTNDPAVEFTLSADEPLNPATVASSDFSATNGTVTGVTEENSQEFTVEITAAADGDVSIAPSGTFSVEDLLGTPTDTAAGTNRTVVYDGTNPVNTIDSNPTDPSRDRTPTFTFSANEPVTGFECSLEPQGDPADFSACTSPYTSSLLSAPGNYRFEVRSTDIAGNTAGTSFNWALQESGITGSSDQNPYFTRGGAPVSVTVLATDNQPGTLSYTQIGGTGSFGSFTVNPGSGTALYTAANGFAGADTVTIRVRNTATNAFTDISFDVIVRPKTVLISGPGVDSDSFTNDNTPTFTFDAVSGPGDVSVPGSGFQCALDNVLLPGSACVGGTWTPAAPLADGEYTLQVVASNPPINQDNVPQSVTFTVDTINPDPPVIVSGTEGLTNNNDLSYQVTIPEGSAECRLIGPGNPNPAWTEDCDDGDLSFGVSFPGVADGDYTFEVRTVDRATNRSTVERLSSTVDTVVEVDITSAPADGNAIARPDVVFSSLEDPNVDYSCRLFPSDADEEDKPVFEACSSPVTLPTLDQNIRYRFEVRGEDPAGNETVESVEWDQTNNAPVVPSPDVTVEAGEQVVIELGSTDADGDEISYSITGPVTGGELGDIDQPTGDVTFTADVDATGVYNFDFEADDGREAGTTPGTVTVRVQPQTIIVTRPPNETNNQRPTWTFESPSAVDTFECRIDDGSGPGAWEPCDGGSFTPDTDLAEGEYTFEVRAVDGALADPTPDIDEVTIDLTAPDTTITDQPATLSNDTTPVFEFESTDPDAVFECSVDGGPFGSCESGDALATLTDGLHTFDVRAIDPATNVGPEASYGWEVDATEPVISLGGEPTGVTNGPGDDKKTNARRPVWYFERSDLNLVEAQVRCRVDNQVWLETCESPFQPPVNLSDGPHTLTIQADDGAGNTGELSISFTVSTVAASVVITEGPESPSGPNATFEFESSVDLGPEGSFACRTSLGGAPFGAWSPCSSPLSLTGLSSGTRTLQVKAIDSAGNESTGEQIASYTWQTIGGEPDTSITGTTINGASAAFAFSSPGNPLATFQCSLDNGTWQACTSPRSYTGLTAGDHNFRVRAINQVGSIDSTPAVHNWTVVAPAAPDTSITRQPPAVTTSPNATFEFVSSASVATFECRIDGGAWEACDSPKSYSDLPVGDRLFEVRSTDTNGLTDQSPASVTWKVATSTVDPAPAELAPPAINAPKKVKSGKAFTLTARITNVGGTATSAKVCLKQPKALVKGAGNVCRNVQVGANGSVSTKFRVKTKPKKSGRQARFQVSVEYTTASGGKQREFKGHVTLMK